MRVAPLLSIAALMAVAGCADIRAINETRDDRQEFSLSGDRLVIDNDGADLRLVAGAGAAIEVQRSLTGKATVDDNASWSMDGGTLRLKVKCSGLVPDCGGRHIVHVPAGVVVEVNSDAPVRAVGLDADFSATVTDAWLRVEESTGALRLHAEEGVDVTGARSANVTVTSTGRSVNLGFASPPDRVEARAAGSVQVSLPGGPETYRVTAAPGRPALTSDPASKRTVTATAGVGHTAQVRKVG
ncbi:hypothetical protein OG777_10585 [Micromonospora peucetia]|uniref:hypothetical protein n=1 Tax=Micromonospora peucetia TaxID=47871 RepID=UPI0022527D7A|nr:hypothetical protein [Micromonospora peucetia]MCX4387379.1 hypothetical protein [Micromonospora peucetia]